MEKLEINISVKYVVPLIKILMSVTDTSAFVAISIAFQIIEAGGIEAHANTMTPDSIWMNDIYPKIRGVKNALSTFNI